MTKKKGWMLGYPEVRKRNNCSAYFDFFLSSLATIHIEINTFFFSENKLVCVFYSYRVSKE